MFAPSKIKIEKKKETATHGSYVISPLPKGYGSTMGNSLRRILLSSIRGAAPTRVKISGASHEFSTLKGVKEDVFNTLLKIKDLKIAIAGEDFDEVKLVLSKKGVGEVKASDIKLPSGVTISNPDLVICTITDAKTTFEADIYAKNGYGYVAGEEAEQENKEVGVMVLDRIFSPVIFANYAVTAARMGKETELDRIELEVETDGTLAPFEAIKQGAGMLRDFFAELASGARVVIEEEEVIVQEVSVEDARTEKAGEILIEELNLPTRTINALKKHSINTLKDLAVMDEDRLLSVRNLGEKSIQEIKKLLKKEGLTE
ncbi:DNA-directed RNA polymerase subunit alpha [bacterium]|nr:DNA-directed RNA polymerase subunit alpha [bacterium]